MVVKSMGSIPIPTAIMKVITPLLAPASPLYKMFESRSGWDEIRP